MMSIAIMSSGGSGSPLGELPLDRFIQWCASMGGKSIKIPTLGDVIQSWEISRHMGNSPELYALWLRKNRGDEITLPELRCALRPVLVDFPDCDASLIYGAASAMLLNSDTIRESILGNE